MKKTIYNIILHLLLVGAVLFGVKQCSRADKSIQELSSKTEIFNKANTIVDTYLDEDSNTVTKSKPSETLLSAPAQSIKNLLDSVSESSKIPKNERIVKYSNVPIESSVSIKAKEVTSEYAYAENDNWYSRYNFKDSIFDLRYKTIYTNIITEKDNKILGINYKPVTTMQYDWIKDKSSSALSPTTVILKDKDNKSNKFRLNNVNKFRSIDNTILTGIETEIELNRFIISGQYNYNINRGFNSPNTSFKDNTEYEVSLKYKILK